MSQYDNEKKIALFKNDKGDNPKRPDYRGTLTVNGVEYKASLWIRQDKKGNDYLNGTIEVKTEGNAPAARAPASDSGPVKTFMKEKPAQTSAPADDSLDAPF